MTGALADYLGSAVAYCNVSTHEHTREAEPCPTLGLPETNCYYMQTCPWPAMPTEALSPVWHHISQTHPHTPCRHPKALPSAPASSLQVHLGQRRFCPRQPHPVLGPLSLLRCRLCSAAARAACSSSFFDSFCGPFSAALLAPAPAPLFTPCTTSVTSHCTNCRVV